MKKLLYILIFFAFPTFYGTCIISAQGIHPNLIKIDKRALNYYTEEQVLEMPESSIQKINYLYTKSFIIPEEMKDKVVPSEIDINDYNQMREYNKRVKTQVINKDNPVKEKDALTENYIFLISIKELNEAYKAIEAGEEPVVHTETD